MIDVVTRAQSKDLFERMKKSALETAYEVPRFDYEMDPDGLPHCADTYNRLGKKGTADVICFVHDDVEFLSKDWDVVVHDLWIEHRFDVLGVIGSKVYNGGALFDAGSVHGVGLVGGDVDGQTAMRILSPRLRYAPVKVVDGLILFVSREFFARNPFDEAFDELFYYDVDLCLRAEKVAVTCDVWVKHWKPKAMYGVYPEGMKKREDYDVLLKAKHGTQEAPRGDQTCAMMMWPDFVRLGQTNGFEGFKRKYTK